MPSFTLWFLESARIRLWYTTEFSTRQLLAMSLIRDDAESTTLTRQSAYIPSPHQMCKLCEKHPYSTCHRKHLVQLWNNFQPQHIQYNIIRSKTWFTGINTPHIRKQPSCLPGRTGCPIIHNQKEKGLSKDNPFFFQTSTTYLCIWYAYIIGDI